MLIRNKETERERRKGGIDNKEWVRQGVVRRGRKEMREGVITRGGALNKEWERRSCD